VQGISMQCRGIMDALLHAVWPRQAVAARHAATCGYAHACNAVASRVAMRILAATCGYARQWLIAAAPPATPRERTAEWTVW
jgi:hypothetical protein